MGSRDQIARLTEQAQKGSQDAFNELYRLTRDRAFFVARSIAGNEQDALDIIQDSYLKAWQNLHGLKQPEQFPAWLRQITGNTAKNYLRRGKPQLFLPGGEENLLDFQAEEDGAYIPDAAMDTAETRRLIMEIVDGLPEDQRLCVLMYYYDDMGLPEIAAALDIPQSTVTSRLYRARRKISDGVEDLERRGTKLYGAAPGPLLVWLLRGAAAESAATALPPVVLGGAAAGTAAVGGGVLASFAVPKIIAGIAALAIAGGGAAAGAEAAKRRSPPPTEAQTTAAAVTAIALAVFEPIEFVLPAPSETRPAATNATAETQMTYGSIPTTGKATPPVTGGVPQTSATTTEQVSTAQKTTAAAVTEAVKTTTTTSTTTTTMTTTSTASTTTTTTTTTKAPPALKRFSRNDSGLFAEFYAVAEDEAAVDFKVNTGLGSTWVEIQIINADGISVAKWDYEVWFSVEATQVTLRTLGHPGLAASYYAVTQWSAGSPGAKQPLPVRIVVMNGAEFLAFDLNKMN